MKRVFMLALLIATLLFRLGFGLCTDLWTSPDNKPIYLLGLKFYCTGLWPYFGPDVTNTIQIPGALQGLLVGLPFYLVPIPEAPYLLLGILSFASLCFFAWYCSHHLPQLPKWWIWAWMLTLPWTLNVATNIYNPSYALFGSVLFFIGALETYSFTTRNLIPKWLATLMMGFGLVWVMQLHLSWVILVPFVIISLYEQAKEFRFRIYLTLIFLLIGAAIPAAVLLPTFVKYGIASGLGNTGQALRFNPGNLLASLNPVEGIVPRFLSFPSYEINRFLDIPNFTGSHSAAHLAFLRAHLWLAPFALILLIAGFLQPPILAVLFFVKANQPRWRAVKYLALFTLGLVITSFLFSMKGPASHTFYVSIPIALLYALYSLERFLTRPKWFYLATFLLGCSIIFHAGLAYDHFYRTSLYVDRSSINEALKTKNFQIVGERPAGAKY